MQHDHYEYAMIVTYTCIHIDARAFISYNPVVNQLKNLVAPCSSYCLHTFDKPQVSLVVVSLVLQIKLL